MNDALRSQISARLAEDPSLSFLPALTNAFPKAEVFLVGGALRDFFLDRETKDLDFVVRGVEMEALHEWLRDLGDVEEVGKRFGVLKFLPAGLSAKTDPFIDIALPRTEHPSIWNQGGYREFEWKSDPTLPIKDDLSRRDFTMNALAFDVKRGQLIDPFDGEADIQHAQIRTVGDAAERFQEDYSRMLRAIRFACQLNFRIEENTWHAIQALFPEINKVILTEHGKDDFVVPREVLGREIARAFLANPRYAILLLRESGGTRLLFPELRDKDDDYFSFVHGHYGATILFALLLRSLQPEIAKRRLKALGLMSVEQHSPARADEDEVAWIIKELQERGETRPHDLSALDIERTFMNPRGTRYLKVRELLGHDNFVLQAKERIKTIREKTATPEGPVSHLIKGEDVLSHAIKPGPRVGALLDEVREAQLAGEIATRRDALAMLTRLVQTKNPG